MNNTVFHYDPRSRSSAPRELEVEPPVTGRPTILKIMPAAPGFLAVYSQESEPWIETDPVLAWAVVRRYTVYGARATMSQEVEPLVLDPECGVLDSPHDLGNFAGIVREGDAGRLEELRTEAHEGARREAARRAAEAQKS